MEQRDRFGNLQGDQYDLAKDGSMRGYTILIVSYSVDERRLEELFKALRKKGFDVKFFNDVPISQVIKGADARTQLWIMASYGGHFPEREVDAACRFFMDRHGLYLWGDNDPLFKDINQISERLMACRLEGNYEGKKILKATHQPRTIGIQASHPIAKGVDQIYEGITISHLDFVGNSTEFMRSSDNRILATSYTTDGRRAVMDGGFTRLQNDYFVTTAGTARYVCNAACWLAGKDL